MFKIKFKQRSQVTSTPGNFQDKRSFVKNDKFMRKIDRDIDLYLDCLCSCINTFKFCNNNIASKFSAAAKLHFCKQKTWQIVF